MAEQKISTMTELTDINAGDYVEVSEDDGAGRYNTKKYDLGDLADAVSKKHDQGTDTTLGTMTADIDMDNTYQVIGLAAPAAAGEAIRQTTSITESNLEQLTDGSDTTLHDHDGISENTSARHSQNTDTKLDEGGANEVTAAELVTLKNTTVPAKADKVHTHAISDVTELPERLNGIYTRISNLEFELFIKTLFMGGEKGFWADPSDTYTLYQNSDGTIAVVDGDPIGLVLDKSGNNYNLQQTVSTSRPKLLDGGIVFDKVDDALTLNVPEGGITGTLFLATTRGTAGYGVSMPEGVWTLGNAFNPLGDVVSAVLVDRSLTVHEKGLLHAFGIAKGGTEFEVETAFQSAFRGWDHLVDFPMIDTSNGTSFSYAWYGCSGLTSFPELDVSNGTSFSYAWYGCTGLTSFPTNFFDNCLATDFPGAFTNTNLTQSSIDGILVSINSNATSNGTFTQSGGSAPSSVGQAAIDAMRARGWTVTTTGGY